jgi:hypothetical protein
VSAQRVRDRLTHCAHALERCASEPDTVGIAASEAAAGGGANGTVCWQTVPAAGSVSVSICATTASSMHCELPPNAV